MARIVIVPGLAVRAYAEPAAEAARAAGHRVSLLRAPAWRGVPIGLEAYGHRLAADLDARGEDVDLLVGLSVGTQAAAATAAATRRVRRLLLVSPTVDPSLRSLPRLLATWWRGNRGHGEPDLTDQIPDQLRAGIPRTAAVFAGTTAAMPLEQVLPHLDAEVAVAHAEHDDLGTAAWAEELAQGAGGTYRLLAGAPHSWPIRDPEGFAALAGELVGAGARP